MTENISILKRLWRAIKPPPAVKADATIAPVPDKQEIDRRQRRLLTGTAAVLLAGGAAWAVYQYISSAPTRADEAYQEGMRLMGSGDSKGAEERFTKALDIWPSLAVAYYQRGLVRKNLNQTDSAVEDFQQAISRDGAMGAAHTALGIISRERGDTARAISEFTAAIQTSPSADAYYQRGQLYESAGEHEKAIADYDAAIHEKPDAPFVYRARAMSSDAIGDHDSAVQDRVTATRIEHPRH